MSARYVVPVAFVVTMLLPPAARAAVTAWTEVVVRVYDTTPQSSADRQAALDVAATIVSAASLEVIWVACDQEGKRQRAKGKGEGIGVRDKGIGVRVCDTPVRAGELALRIVSSGGPIDDHGNLPLGDALIDTRAGAGVLATVYWDRVAWMAAQTGADRRALLGRAIAHELGHLLMATRAHGEGGLMRAVWSRAELRRSRTTDWVFGPVEIATIRARTGVRGGHGSDLSMD